MNSNPAHSREVHSRNEAFVERCATRIWHESPCDDNPYISQSAHCHGYNLVELMEKRSFVDVFYLLFRGELPSSEDAQLLEALMIGLINPGPRHPATRAAMNAGVGKTDPMHILPIATAVFGGKYQGGGEVEAAMRFLRQQQRSDPAIIAQQQLETLSTSDGDNNNVTVAPGFGSCYGGIDQLAESLVQQLNTLSAAKNSRALQWGQRFATALHPQGFGWLSTGIAAAIFTDLGFLPRMGGCLFQLLGAPGLVAHGVELANKPFTAMPYIKDEAYVIEDKT